MRRLVYDDNASSWPVIMVIICIGVASLMILVFGEVLTPFFQLMDSTDTEIDANISQARGYASQFFQIIWPKGVMVVVLIGVLFAMIMDYQKKRYMET